MLDQGVRRRTHCALARSAQTTAASQFTKCVCPSAHAPPPALRFSARTEGNPGRKTTQAIAALGLHRAGAARRERGAERSDGPCSFHPLLAAPAAGRLRGAPWNSLCASRAARTTTASQFTKHARFDAHAHPASAPTQVCPFAPRRGRRLQGRLSFGYFSLRDLQNSSTQPNLPLREAQKKLRAPPKRLEDQGIEV